MATSRKGCCPLRPCGTKEIETSKPLAHIIVPDTFENTKKVPASDSSAISSFVKGGLGLMVPATVDIVVAYSTSYWATYTVEPSGVHGGYGLWKVWNCAGTKPEGTEEGLVVLKDTTSCEEKFADSTFPAWHIAIQVMMTISLAGMLSSFVMLLLYIFWSHWQRSKKIMSIIISISYFSGLNLLVSLFVFGFKASEEIESMQPTEWLLSWSFSLACTSFVMNQISASILITENKRLRWDNDPDSKDCQYDDSGEKDESLPIYVPEPSRVVYAPARSVMIKNLKIGPPPKDAPPQEELQSVVGKPFDC